YLNESRHKTKMIINPIFSSLRDEGGNLADLKGGTEGAERESFIHIEIERIEEGHLETMKKELELILFAVQHCVEDFQDMAAVLRELGDSFKAGRIPVSDSESFSQYDAINFLDWLLDNNFILLGYRRYDLREESGEYLVQLKENSGRGLMRNDEQSTYFKPTPINSLQKSIKERAFISTPIHIDKTRRKSVVHRRVPMDFIEIREFTEDRKPYRWHRFIGLFTRKALFEQAGNIPILNKKLKALVDYKNVVEGSSIHREVLTVFNSLPKELLFFSSIEELDSLIQLIVHAYREQSIRLFARMAFIGGALSIVVAMPEKYYSTQNTADIADLFKTHFSAEFIQYYQTRSHPGFWEIHYFLSLPDKGDMPDIPVKILEEKVTEIVKDWKDRLTDLIETSLPIETSEKYIEKYLPVFSRKYQSTWSAETALKDISYFEKFYETGSNQYDFIHPGEDSSANEGFTPLRIYSREKISLTYIMPILENLGLKVIDESAYHFTPSGGDIYLHVFAVTDMAGQVLDPVLCEGLLEEALDMVMSNRLENGLLNALITQTGMNYKQINLLRTYYNYYFLIERVFTRKTVSQIAIRYAHIFQMLFQLYDLKFNPALDLSTRDVDVIAKQDEILELIKEITDINEDRVLKAFYNLIDSTIRTNYYSREQGNSFLISIKVMSSRVLNMPDPRPKYEIYVYSPIMEGIHLRGGMIARGGLRWSDRIDDFRTEVLALMKTQMTKNAVIVPVGSKGGFVIRSTDYDRRDKEFLKEQYQQFISGLLDITDNIVDGKVIHPNNVLHYDGEDPYLVVAADKGTAHLSDAANEMSERYGFWLGDAFASGGSHGYDHKAEGITAKGAWECVKRHFRELDKDIQNEEFSVIGIGDMSGDVFGNGMLLSRKILLKAAFNHIHIFIDPEPESEASFLERERLFKVPGSKWTDYKPELISKGGGIFNRNDKAIRLTPEIKSLLDTDKDEVSGDELIRLILLADVELLW
ncbi:MAG: NAD-glutamate dehydrogenase, partial [Spirochaetota bacterium]|nr:NAD-glutamate dehydrogenase [Spirochaetota bacterium]